MLSKISRVKCNIFQKRYNKLLLFGLNHSFISFYDEELISKLRNIYYGCIPASIILLCDSLCNGYCYDRGFLLARAFLDTEDDVKLVYGTVDSIKYNPNIKDKSDPMYADHCFVEVKKTNGKCYVYDTSSGLVYDKDYYWFIEKPNVRLVRRKESIQEFIDSDPHRFEQDDNSLALNIIPLIEETYNNKNEIYSKEGIELLQKEVELYKKKINYDQLKEDIFGDMKKRGMC